MPKQVEKPSLATADNLQISIAAIAENYQWIAESAYYKALARGFTPHRDQDDWLEAKKEYLAWLSKRRKNGLIRLR